MPAPVKNLTWEPPRRRKSDGRHPAQKPKSKK